MATYAALPRHLLACVILAGMIGCNSQTDKIVILNRTLKQGSYTNSAVPEGTGSLAGLNGTIYYVEGLVQNKGTVDIHHLDISFPCKAGADKRLLTAQIPLLPAGKTIEFRTKPYESRYSVTLLADTEPELNIGQ